MLSHLLAQAGIDNVVVEKRDHETIRTTHRAGILEHGSVDMLVDSGVSDRVLKAGYKHEGIDLRFGGVSHRIDFDRPGRRGGLAVPAERGVRRPRRRPGARRRARSTTPSPTPRCSDLTTDTPKIRFTDSGRQRARRSTPRSWSAPTGRRGSASGRFRRNTAPTTSSSTPSPGSASCARRRPAPRN